VSRGDLRLICATAIVAAGLEIGCATTTAASAASVAVTLDEARSSSSSVTAPLTARVVAPAPPPTPSDLAAASLVQNVAGFELHRDAGAPRQRVIPTAFRVDDLPSFDPPRALDGAHPPVVAGGIDATELQLDWHATGHAPDKLDPPTVVRVGLTVSTWARLRIGSSEAAIGPESAGGVFLTCGGPQGIPQPLVPARWEAVTVTPDRGVEYHVTTAWFDPRTCSAHIMEHRSVKAAPLAGRLLHAFRAPCAFACDGGELVTILGPRFDTLATSATGGDVSSADGALTRVTLPVRQGAAASMVGRALASTTEPWTRRLGIDVPRSGVVVGVEVAQGVADDEPIAIAYVGVTEGDGTSPRSRL
jgi:hypothetical protein